MNLSNSSQQVCVNEARHPAFVFETLMSILHFEQPATVEEAASRGYRSTATALETVEESFEAVHATIERFGRAKIEAALGASGPRTFRIYDAFVKLVGEEYFLPSGTR